MHLYRKISTQLSLMVAVATFLFSAACKKDPAPTPTPAPTTGALTLKVENYAGIKPLKVTGVDTYVNAMSEKFTVSTYKYYLSNFVFYKADGTQYTQPESYYLINAADDASLSWTVYNLPFGDYDSVSFMIGVDRVRNTEGAQTGALSQSNGMFWSWSQGYIMAKIEGYSPSSGSGSKLFSIHIGGFQGQYATQQMVNLKLPAKASVNATKIPQITLRSDVLQWFTSPKDLSFNTTYAIGSIGADAVEVATNYADMMSVISVN